MKTWIEEFREMTCLLRDEAHFLNSKGLACKTLGLERLGDDLLSISKTMTRLCDEIDEMVGKKVDIDYQAQVQATSNVINTALAVAELANKRG
jgi:hypothetical protein